MWNHKAPYRTIQDHMGTFRTHKGPCGTKQDNKGPKKPYWTMQVNIEPYRTISGHGGHKGPYWTKGDHTGPYWTLWDHTWPYRTKQYHAFLSVSFFLCEVAHATKNIFPSGRKCKRLFIKRWPEPRTKMRLLKLKVSRIWLWNLASSWVLFFTGYRQKGYLPERHQQSLGID